MRLVTCVCVSVCVWQWRCCRRWWTAVWEGRWDSRWPALRGTWDPCVCHAEPRPLEGLTATRWTSANVRHFMYFKCLFRQYSWWIQTNFSSSFHSKNFVNLLYVKHSYGFDPAHCVCVCVCVCVCRWWQRGSWRSSEDRIWQCTEKGRKPIRN